MKKSACVCKTAELMHAIDELEKTLYLIPSSWKVRMPDEVDIATAKMVVETDVKEALNAIDGFVEACGISEVQASSLRELLEQAGRIASEKGFTVAQRVVEDVRKRLTELVCPTGI